MKTFRTRPKPIVLAAVMLVAPGCDIFHRWDAVVYVNKFDLGNSLDIGTFDTLEACREAALNKLAELKAGELSSYVCGENCMVKNGFDNTRMCARTSR